MLTLANIYVMLANVNKGMMLTSVNIDRNPD